MINGENESIGLNIEDINEIEKEGFYAPLTTHGTLFVNGMLVSSFAEWDNNRVMQWAFGPYRMMKTMGLFKG